MQLAGPLRERVCEIPRFADVARQVVELRASVLEVLDQLPVALANSAGRTRAARQVQRVVPEDRTVLQSRASLEEPYEALAVNRLAGRQGHASQLCERRQKVNARDRDGGLAPGLDDTRPPHAGGHAYPPFVQRALHASQGPVDRDAGSAIVGREDDQSLLAEVQLVKSLHDTPDARVDSLHHGRVGRIIGIPIRRP